MLVGLESLRERILILLAGLAEERQHLWTSAGWVLAQASALAYAAIFAAVGFELDRWLADRPNDPAAPGAYALLPPVLAAGAAAFVFLMATWLSIVQSSASRFDSAAVVARLSDDWASTFALRLLFAVVLTAIAGLATPLITGRAVTFGAYVPVALLVLSLPLLLSFRRYALMLAHPGRFAEVVRSENEQRLVRISSARHPTRSVSNHIRKLVSSDFAVWDGLLLHTADKDPSLHYVITQNLALVVALYWNRKTAIPVDSPWFPQREVASEDRNLRQITSEQGLGQARATERDAEWLEHAALAVLERTATRDTPVNQTRSDVLAALAELLRLGWHRQETAALRAVQARWSAERAALRGPDYDHWAAPVVNGLIAFADEVLRHQLRLSEILPLREYPELAELTSSFLPAELLAGLRLAAAEIDAETVVAGRVVTPLTVLSTELDNRLRTRQDELADGAIRWVLDELEAAIKGVIASNATSSPDAASDLFGAMLLIVNRSYYLEAPGRSAAALAAAIRLFPTVVRQLMSASDEKRLQMNREARVVALKAMRDNWSEAKPATLLALKVALLDAIRESSVRENRLHPWLETLLVLGGMAFACGEVRSNHELVDLVIETLRNATIDLAALARLKPVLRELPAFGLGPSLTLEYQTFLGPLFEEVSKLGTREAGRAGEFVLDDEVNTDSEWLRAHSYLLMFGFEDAIEGFLDYAAPLGPAGDSSVEPSPP